MVNAGNDNEVNEAATNPKLPDNVTKFVIVNVVRAGRVELNAPFIAVRTGALIVAIKVPDGVKAPPILVNAGNDNEVKTFAVIAYAPLTFCKSVSVNVVRELAVTEKAPKIEVNTGNDNVVRDVADVTVNAPVSTCNAGKLKLDNEFIFESKIP